MGWGFGDRISKVINCVTIPCCYSFYWKKWAYISHFDITSAETFKTFHGSFMNIALDLKNETFFKSYIITQIVEILSICQMTKNFIQFVVEFCSVYFCTWQSSGGWSPNCKVYYVEHHVSPLFLAEKSLSAYSAYLQ